MVIRMTIHSACPYVTPASYITLRAIREAAVGKLDSFKARARALARSGYFYGLPPLEFELSFEQGFNEAREWLELASTEEELERLCQASRAKHKAA